MRINGMKVVDAKKAVQLHITAGDVSKGNTKDPAACAAARACVRDLDCTEARIHLGRAYLRKGDVWVRHMTTPALRNEIVAFDRGAPFEPGIYTLGPVPPSQSTRVRNDKRTNKPSGKKKPRKLIARVVRHMHQTTNVRARGANR